MTEYSESTRVVRKTYMDVLPVAGENQALEASRRMAEWLGMSPLVAEETAEEFEELGRGFVDNV